ncbi:LysR substrate-binding domain-containing protein [Pigmentiphaga litoralis]|uniref:LysR family transcriptional regulator n=1 Tax=Pigmentiphaga litoralis TaxID=516702 RepID=UPI003B427C2F
MPDTTPSAHAKVLFARLMTHGRLRQLRLLVAMDDHGSIARAAASIHLSQSAATQAVADLERLLEVKLFERHARGIRPTTAGQALIAAARGATAGLQSAAEALSALQRGATGTLRLGAIPAASYTLLPPLLEVFCAEHPGVHLDVQEGAGTALLPLLLAEHLDAVFCRAPPSLPSGFAFTPLLADDVVVIGAASHPMAGKADVSLESLANSRWIMPTVNIEVRAIFDAVVLRNFPDAQFLMVSTVSVPVLDGLLQQGNAATICPRSVSKGLLANPRICLLDVTLPARLPPLSPLGVAYREDNTAEPLQNLLLLARPAAASMTRRPAGLAVPTTHSAAS